MTKLVFAALLTISFNAFAAAPNCEAEATYPEISKADLQKAIDGKTATIFDVNGTDSFKKAHVTGAYDYMATKSAFAQNLPKDKNAMVVAYCGGPSCTAWKAAAIEACKMGYTNVKHFKAGLKGWTAKN